MIEWLISAAAFAALFVVFGLAGRGGTAPHGCGGCRTEGESCAHGRCVRDRATGDAQEGDSTPRHRVPRHRIPNHRMPNHRLEGE